MLRVVARGACGGGGLVTPSWRRRPVVTYDGDQDEELTIQARYQYTERRINYPATEGSTSGKPHYQIREYSTVCRVPRIVAPWWGTRAPQSEEARSASQQHTAYRPFS